MSTFREYLSESENVVTLTLKKKNEFEWAVKDGRKVVAKIVSVTDGFHTMSKVFDTLDDAIVYIKRSLADRYSAFSKDDTEYTIIINEATSLEDKVRKLLIKYGNNPDDVEKMLAQEFAYIVKTYPDAKAAKLAEIIRVIY